MGYNKYLTSFIKTFFWQCYYNISNTTKLKITRNRTLIQNFFDLVAPYTDLKILLVYLFTSIKRSFSIFF